MQAWLIALLFATAAAGADERWVPVDGRTTLEISNPSSRAVTVSIGANRVESIGPGQSVRWDAPPDAALSVMRIAADGDVHVRGFTTTASASATVPCVTSRDAVEASLLDPAEPWQTGVLAANPGADVVILDVDGGAYVLGPRESVYVERATQVEASAPVLVFAVRTHARTEARVVTPVTTAAAPRKRRAVRSVTSTPVPQTITLTPAADNTLYESTTGAISNGSGIHVFAWVTARATSRRRALLRFDVAGQIPAGSRITRAVLKLRVSQTISGALPVALHRVSTAWGEGSSNAGPASDGDGAAAAAGDATWLHTFFPDRRWTSAGGDFETAADATADVDATSGTWESSAMTSRVQQWLEQPASNFGWILIGPEPARATAKRFDSREAPSATSRPALLVEFQR